MGGDSDVTALEKLAQARSDHHHGDSRCRRDVDIALKQRLEQTRDFAKVQREFDLNAWQMFLALNWPTNDQGQSAPRIEDAGFGPPHWSLWHNSSAIF